MMILLGIMHLVFIRTTAVDISRKADLIAATFVSQPVCFSQGSANFGKQATAGT